MRKLFYLLSLTLLLGSLNAMAQEASEVTQFTSYYGRVVQVGDTLWMGKPTDEYYSYIMLNKANKDGKFMAANLTQWHKQPLVVTELMSSPKTMRVDCYPYEANVVMKCKAPDGSNLLVDLDNAVYNNVIQIEKPYDMTFRNKCEELTPLKHHLYYIHTKQIELNDKSLLEYMIYADPEKGEVCKHDQFEFRRVKNGYYNRLQRDLSLLTKQMEEGTTFYIKKGNIYSSETYNPEIGGYQYTKLYNCDNSGTVGYSDYNIRFVHQPCETILKMIESTAEMYERKRKGDSPYLHRNETAVIYFSLMSLDSEPSSIEHVCALLLAVEVFDDPSGEVNHIGYAEFDPNHYENVKKQLKREQRTNAVGTVIGGVLGILSLF